jgi:hypothetical protein
MMYYCALLFRSKYPFCLKYTGVPFTLIESHRVSTEYCALGKSNCRHT